MAFGVPDKMYGEVVWACVVPKAGASVTEKDVIKDVGKRLTKVSLVNIADGLATNACRPVQGSCPSVGCRCHSQGCDR